MFVKAHSQKLKLFCVTDQQLVCAVCRDSDEHRKHRFEPVRESAEVLKSELQDSLSSLKDRLVLVEEFKETCEFTVTHIESQSRHSENLIEKEFRKLQDFIAQQYKSRMKALRKEKELKSKSLKDKMAAVIREIEVLSETISATEQQLAAADVSFLLEYKAAVEKVDHCSTLKEKLKLGPEALINQAKHVGNLTFNIWNDMKKLVRYTPIVLDPNTAHPKLVLSDDLSSFIVRDEQKLPPNPERIRNDEVYVRSSEGFDSGSHSWDVDVGDSKAWELAVITKSAYNISADDENFGDDDGWWSLAHANNSYWAFSLDKKKDEIVKMKSTPRKIRLHLDFNKRTLTFYDVDTNTCIYSFTRLHRQKLFPVFESQTTLKILEQEMWCSGLSNPFQKRSQRKTDGSKCTHKTRRNRARTEDFFLKSRSRPESGRFSAKRK